MTDKTYCAAPCTTRDCDRHPSKAPESKGHVLSFANFAPDCKRFKVDLKRFERSASWLQSLDG